MSQSNPHLCTPIVIETIAHRARLEPPKLAGLAYGCADRTFIHVEQNDNTYTLEAGNAQRITFRSEVAPV